MGKKGLLYGYIGLKMPTMDALRCESSLIPDTRGKILAAARKLFSRKWYSVVSVADICRTASLSNGVFYRYFRSKDEVFRLLIEQFIALTEKALASISPTGEPEQDWRRFIDVLFDGFNTHRDLLRIFREGQYRSCEYEQRLTGCCCRELVRIFGRPFSPVEALYILSGLRFCAVRAIFDKVPVHAEDLFRAVRFGIFDHAPGADRERIFNIEINPLPIKIRKNSRERLLTSGRALFGEKGYHKVNIHDITHAAELSVGSFYMHFTSKELFYTEIIERVSHDIRRFIQRNIDGSLSRIDQEAQGMYLFCCYISLDKTAYNLVREGEFVVPGTVKAYYDDFQDGYFRNLPGTRNLDRTTAANFLLGLSHYLGIELFYGPSANFQSESEKMIQELTEYMHHGLNIT